jgi:deferrochelatase/peroxidase EfeB
MPSAGKLKRRKPAGKTSRKTSRKKSELDSALGQISDESVAEAKNEFQDLLAQAKGDTSELVRHNAEELERRLVLLKKRKIDKEDFNFFVENQKRDLRVFIDGQPAQAQERAEKLTLRVLEIAARVAIALI